MIDYVSTEIVSYADDIVYPSVELAYPNSLSVYDIYDSDTFTVIYGIDGGVTQYIGQWVYAFTGSYLDENSDYYGDNGKIYALLLIALDNNTYYGKSIVDTIGVGYYTIKEAPNVSGAYDLWFVTKIPYEELPINIVNPFINGYSGNIDIQGEGVIFLYGLGKHLADFCVGVYEDILMYPVGTTNLFTIICGSGFFIYMVWVVVKFAIPL